MVEDGPLYDQIVAAQRNSVEYQTTRARRHRMRAGEDRITQRWQHTLCTQYVVEDELVWYVGDGKKTLVVPMNYWPRVIEKYHNSLEAGHPGREETTRAIA